LVPNSVSTTWRRVVRTLKLPKVSFHALRHTHVSQLIASGRLDILTISRRIGHSKASITLDIYGHLMKPTDTAAADVFQQAFGNSSGTKMTLVRWQLGGNRAEIACSLGLKYLICRWDPVAQPDRAPAF